MKLEKKVMIVGMIIIMISLGLLTYFSSSWDDNTKGKEIQTRSQYFIISFNGRPMS